MSANEGEKRHRKRLAGCRDIIDNNDRVDLAPTLARSAKAARTDFTAMRCSMEPTAD